MTVTQNTRKSPSRLLYRPKNRPALCEFLYLARANPDARYYSFFPYKMKQSIQTIPHRNPRLQGRNPGPGLLYARPAQAVTPVEPEKGNESRKAGERRTRPQREQRPKTRWRASIRYRVQADPCRRGCEVNRSARPGEIHRPTPPGYTGTSWIQILLFWWEMVFTLSGPEAKTVPKKPIFCPHFRKLK